MKRIFMIILVAEVLSLIIVVGAIPKGKVEAPHKLVQVIKLTDRQVIWLKALEWCESSGRVGAINPRDRDDTPSYGILQFKPGTFKYYTEKYQIDVPIVKNGKRIYMDPIIQEKIVEQMIIRNDVRWDRQFPGCTRKIGRPPFIHTKRIDKK